MLNRINKIYQPILLLILPVLYVVFYRLMNVWYSTDYGNYLIRILLEGILIALFVCTYYGISVKYAMRKGQKYFALCILLVIALWNVIPTALNFNISIDWLPFNDLPSFRNAVFILIGLVGMIKV